MRQRKTRRTNSRLMRNVGMGMLLYFAYNQLKKGLRFMKMEGKVVVISGGSRGLGFVLAKELAKKGASVCLLARDKEELQRAQNQIQFEVPTSEVIYQVCDSTNPRQTLTAMERCFDHFKRIDVVINNAGVITVSPYENLSAADFEESLKVHFWASYNITEAARPFMKATGGGRIVNISSIGGKVPVMHLSSYCTGKFALVGYSRSIRPELLKDNIYVTTVCPGLMRTGSVDHAQFRGQHSKEYSWFALADSMPLLTMSAERAARKIIEAMQSGQAEINISLPTKIAIAVQGIAPELTADFMAVANLLMPSAPVFSELKKGSESHSSVAPSFLTKLTDDAALRNNEKRI